MVWEGGTDTGPTGAEAHGQLFCKTLTARPQTYEYEAQGSHIVAP